MRVPIWLSLLGSLILVVLLPLLFGSLMTTSLAKLHVSQSVATQLVIGIIAGGFINVPIARIARSEQVPAHSFGPRPGFSAAEAGAGGNGDCDQRRGSRNTGRLGDIRTRISQRPGPRTARECRP